MPLPASLEGKRCLDVATFNGFWGFEMERRGAAEVIGIDVLDPGEWDWPVGSERSVIETIGERQAGGRGFEIAKRELGSSVTRVERNVYDLDESELGRFDVVYLGSLLVHLRDPVRALERVRSVCDGTLIVVDAIDLPLSLLHPRAPVAALDGRGRPWWWYSNAAGLARLVEAGGFEVTDRPRRLYVKPGKGQPLSRDPRLLRTKAGRLALDDRPAGRPARARRGPAARDRLNGRGRAQGPRRAGPQAARGPFAGRPPGSRRTSRGGGSHPLVRPLQRRARL